MTGFLTPYFIICGFAIWVLYKNNKNILINDLFWLIISWTALLGLYLFSGITFYYVPGAKTWIYIIAFFTVYIMGRAFGMKTRKNQYGRNIRVSDNILFLIVFIGTFLRLYDIISSNGFLHINRNNMQSTLVGVVGSLMNPLGLPLSLKIGFHAKLEGKRIPAKAYMALMLYVLPVIFLSGRLNLLFAIIAIICLLLYKPNAVDMSQKKEVSSDKKKRRKKIIAIVAICAVAFIFFKYTNYIILDRFSSLEEMLSVSGLNDSFTLSENTKSFYNSFGNFKGLISQAALYYGAQFKNIALIIEQFHGPYSFGFVQMPYIARRSDFLQKITKSTNDALRAATAIGGRPFDGSGRAWVTVVGDMVIDFGMIGGLLIVFFIGVLIGRKRSVFLKNPNNPYELSIQVMLCVCMFFTIQLSPFFETTLVYAFIWMWILAHFRIKK